MPTPSNRAGRYVQQATGYRAFVPEPLPPEPPIVFDGELQTELSTADRDLARLDAGGNMSHSVDFRNLYATVLERWWQIDSREILGGRFAPLRFLG